jgi:hypothetical protein
MKIRLCLSFLAVSLLFVSCAPGREGLDTSSVLETMVAATVRALPTATLVPSATITATATRTTVVLPTATPWPTEPPSRTPGPIPSLTPFPSLTAAATYRVVKITPGPRQGDYNFACRSLSYNPVHYYNLSPTQTFTVSWRVKNDGASEWDLNSIDVAMRSGEKMAIGGTRFDLSESVPSGSSYTISITMKAPNKPGEYANTWSLARGDSFFCKLSFRAYVVVK